MNPEEISSDLLSVNEKGYVDYDDKPLIIKTDWINCYYSEEFKTISVNLKENDGLYCVLKDIDRIVGEEMEQFSDEKLKQSKLLKHYNNKTGDRVYTCSPKFEYSNIFDEKRNNLSLNEFCKRLNTSECRMIFGLNKLKTFKNYYGCKLVCKQIQIRPREKMQQYKECMFE